MKKQISFLIVLIALLTIISISFIEYNKIDSFEDCVSAGNPVMESYPRQCRTASGDLFVENLDDSAIGGQKDSNGCLIAAGYSWNMTTQTCVREWELQQRNYIKENIEECKTIQFLCAESFIPFYDATGCGCELNTTTQEEFKVIG